MESPNRGGLLDDLYERAETPLSGDDRDNDDVFEDAMSPLDSLRYPPFEALNKEYSPPASSKSEDAGRGSRDSKGVSDGSFPSFSSPCASPMTDTSYHSHSPSTEASDAKFAFQDQGLDRSTILSMPPTTTIKTTLDEALKSEQDFMEFVMSLPAPKIQPEIPESSKVLKSSSAGSVVKSSKVGLDHLDNLCKLMQQLGELREANAKLQKKVQYLEVMRSLHDMQSGVIPRAPANVVMCKMSKDVSRVSPVTSEKPTSASPVTVRNLQSRDATRDSASISKDKRSSPPLKERRYTVYKSKTQVNIHQAAVRTRERSKSVGHEEFVDGKSKKKFPKWTKVKEALGLERLGQLERHDARHSNYPDEFYTSKRERCKKTIRSAGHVHGGAGDHSAKYASIYGTSHYSTNDFLPSISVQGPSSGKNSQRSSLLSADEIMDTMEDCYGIRYGSLKRRSIPSRGDGCLDRTHEEQRRRRSTPSPTHGTRASSSAKEETPIKSTEDSRDLHPHLALERDTDVDSDMSKYDKEDLKKTHKSPWGRVKTLIQTRRESLRRKQRKEGGVSSIKRELQRQDAEPPGIFTGIEISAVSDDVESELPSEIATSQDIALNESIPKMQTQELRPQESTPSNEGQIGRRIDSAPGTEPRSLSQPNKREDTQTSRSKDSSTRESLEKQIHRHKPLELSLSEPAEVSGSDREVAETRKSKKKIKPKPLNLISPCQDDVPFLSVHGTGFNDSPRTPSPSPPLHRKSRWNRVKKVFGSKRDDGARSQSVPASPNTAADGNFVYDLALIEDETSEEKSDEKNKENKIIGVSKSSSYGASPPMAVPRPDMASGGGVSGTSPPMADLVQELQRNLSEDFSKKIREWEKMRSSGFGAGNCGYASNYPSYGGQLIGKTSPTLERKGSDNKTKKGKQDKSNKTDREKANKQRMKDLNWLEKELQKVEREKQRLAKERQKFEERAIRLERLRETVINAQTTNKKEVLVRTSAGEFRFEGISDAFTKKLYEWETKRGVGPELSTIALLDASLKGKLQKPGSANEKNAPLQRGLSKSESSLVELNQPSQTSSASLPSLKHDAALQTDFSQASRSNSVPELPSFCAAKETILPPRSQSGEILASNASIVEGQEFESYAPPEVTQLIDSDSEEPYSTESKRTDAEQIESREALQSEDNYYTLLEENMFLLEQLKRKEEICRRLEEELETLDDRVEDMNSRHQQEMERYREKLWEVHKMESKPRALQGSLRLITELKERIQELERCSERLKADKETLEDSFRYHSEQQARLTVDLIEKMKELQQITIAGGNAKEVEGRPRRRRRNFMRCDAENVVRLHDLSTQLLRQARELEHVLVERTRQVCRLRWELLHREVSAMRLQTELHRARVQGGTVHPSAVAGAISRRIRYGKQRSWSSSDRLTLSQPEQQEANGEADRVRERLKHITASASPDNWSKIEYDATELTTTVQELKMELLKLCAAAEQPTESEEGASEVETYASSHPELSDVGRYKIPSTTMISSPLTMQDNYESFAMCEPGATGNHSITVRRNSADNVSSISGPEGSESSSLNDGERMSFALRLPRHRWRRSRDNISTSSESSFIEEETFTSVPWCRPRTSSDFGSEEKEIAISPDDINARELILKYSLSHDYRRNLHGRNSDPGFMASSSRSSSEMTDQHRDSWSEVYHRRLLRGEQTSETSSSAVNMPWDESSSSGERVARYRYQDSTEREEKGLPSIQEITHGSGVSVNKCVDLADKEGGGQEHYECQEIQEQPTTQIIKSDEQPMAIVASDLISDDDKIKTVDEEKENVSKDAESLIASRCSEHCESLSSILDDKQSSDASTIVGHFASENNMLSVGDDFKKDLNECRNDREKHLQSGGSELHPLQRASQFSFHSHLLGEYRDPFQPREHEQYGRTQRSYSVPEVRRDLSKSLVISTILEDHSRQSERQSENRIRKKQKSSASGDSTETQETLPTSGPEEKISSKEALPGKKMCDEMKSSANVSEKAEDPKKKSPPSVKPLIERYNQRFGEDSWPSKVMDRSITRQVAETPQVIPEVSKIELGGKITHSNVQESSRNMAGSTIPTTLPIVYLPPSPSSQARAEALRKAKEEFIKTTGKVEFPPVFLSSWDSNLSQPQEALKPKGFTLPRVGVTSLQKQPENEESVNLVNQLPNTAEFQADKPEDFSSGRMCAGSVESITAKPDLTPHQPSLTSTNIKGSRSNPALATLSTCPSSAQRRDSSSGTGSKSQSSSFLNIKLKKSKRKKDMPTISALCKQSLYLNIDAANESSPSETSDKPSPGCSSSHSPEDKTKTGKTKSTWLHVNLFKSK